MKFSNIACVALLGATLATSAYAADTDLTTTGSVYDTSVSQYQFFNKLQGDLNALKDSDIKVTGAKTTVGALNTENTAFTKLLNDMFKFGSDVVFGSTGLVLESLGSSNYKVTLTGENNKDGLTSIKIADQSDANSDTITLVDGVLNIVQVGTGIVSTATTGLAKASVEGIITALSTKSQTLVDAKAKDYLGKLKDLNNESTPASADLPLLTNINNNKITVQLLKDDIAAVAIKAAKTASTDTAKLKAANEALAASGSTIKVGEKTYNGTSAPLTKDMISTVQDANTVGNVKISDAVGTDVVNAQSFLASYDNIIEGSAINTALKTSATDSTNGIGQTALHGATATLDTNPFTDAGIKAVFGLGEKDTFEASKITVTQLAQFSAKFNKIKADLQKAKDMPMSNDTQKQARLDAEKRAVSEAIAANLQFSADSTATSGTALTSKTIPSSTKDNNTGTNSVNQAVENALSLFGDAKALGKLLKSISALETGYIARADAIANYNNAINANTETSQAANALGTIPTNNLATSMLINDTASDIVKTVKNITNSTNDVASSLTTKTLDVLRNSDILSTSTRLAKLSNPFNSDLGLASALDKLNTNGDSFAAMNDSSLSSVIKEYTTRFENDANVWANVIGGKGVVKEGMNSTVFGASAGYDKKLDNTILGGYFSYAKSRASKDLSSVNTDNFELGLYGRTFIDNHEIDYTANIGTGKAKTNRNFLVSSSSAISHQEGSFNTTFANLGVDYGYVIDLGNTSFIKPLVGINFNYAKNGEFDETQNTNNIAQHFGSVKNSELSAKLGAEYRKYVSTGNYFYVTPAVETELYKSNKDLTVNYIGSNQGINVPIDNKKGTYFTLNTGLDLKVTDSVSTNVSFGTKLGSKAQYYNGTFGIRYAF